MPKHQSECPLIHSLDLGNHTIICLSELITYLYHILCSCHIAFQVHVHVSIHFHISYHIHVARTQLYILHFIYLYSMMPIYSHIIHVFLSLYESILLRNWNHSNWIIQTKVMAFSCQTSQFTDITLGKVFDTGSLYAFQSKVLWVLLQLESPKSEHRNSSYVRNNRDYSIFKN